MINITIKDFIELMKNVDKNTFIHLKTISKVDMKKKQNPYYDKVYKYTSGNFLIGNSYEDRVNNNMTREGIEDKYILGQNKIGRHVSRCVLYNDKLDRYYLQVEYLPNTVHESRYFLDDKEINKDILEISKDILEPWLKTTDYNRQQQDKKVEYKVFKFDSIIEASLNKEKYVIIHN